jgi:hypothetical protein
MSTGTKAGAVKAAGDRLEAIERWSRHTFIVAVVGTSLLGILTTISVIFAIDYIRLKWAMANAQESFRQSMQGGTAPTKGGLTFDPSRGLEDLKSRFGGEAAKVKSPARK